MKDNQKNFEFLTYVFVYNIRKHKFSLYMYIYVVYVILVCSFKLLFTENVLVENTNDRRITVLYDLETYFLA